MWSELLQLRTHSGGIIHSSCCGSRIRICDPMDCSTPGFLVPQYFLEFAQTHVHWVSDAIQPSHPLLPTSPPAFNLSQHQGLFQWVGSSHQVSKVLELQLQLQPFNEYSELVFYRVDWFDLLAVQGTLRSLLQYHNSKAAILWCSAFFMVQLSHPYMTNWKNHRSDQKKVTVSKSCTVSWFQLKHVSSSEGPIWKEALATNWNVSDEEVLGGEDSGKYVCEGIVQRSGTIWQIENKLSLGSQVAVRRPAVSNSNFQEARRETSMRETEHA